MNKRLVLIAAVSFSVAAACALLTVLTSAAGLVGGDYRSWLATTRTCAAMPWVKKAAEPRTADLGWSGSDVVKIRIPAQVHYQPGPTAQASVSGDAELVSHVRMRDGTLEWDTIDDCLPAHDLVVRLSGPAVPAWTLNGSGDLDLSGISQDVLRITMHGSGTVTASGEARETSLDVAGSSSADLSKLLTQQATARIRGSAEVDLSPREDVDISISGSAVVRLHGAGARIRSRVSGSGQIKQVP
jgi:Putative auto-transporter adhesin, head GIN domain